MLFLKQYTTENQIHPICLSQSMDLKDYAFVSALVLYQICINNLPSSHDSEVSGAVQFPSGGRYPCGWHGPSAAEAVGKTHQHTVHIIILYFCPIYLKTRFWYKEGGPAASHVQLSFSHHHINISFFVE